jgi:hypothetical protein
MRIAKDEKVQTTMQQFATNHRSRTKHAEDESFFI